MPIELVELGHVYEGRDGSLRMVASCSGQGEKALVLWQSPDPALPAGEKAHGSATVASFKRWASQHVRRATKEDWQALPALQNARRWRKTDRAAVRRIRQRTVNV